MPSIDPSPPLGNGFIEIAALTAIIGSTTVESLILGSRGAAGLPWAAVSNFGSIFLAKACLAASTPAWLCETLGVRNSRSDAAVGLSFDLQRKAKGIKSADKAVGLSVKVYQDATAGGEKSGDELRCDQFEQIYEFDESTAVALRSSTASEAGDRLQVHTYMRDQHWNDMHSSHIRLDWLAMALTFTKVSESYVLYQYGAKKLYWTTAVNWCFFLLSAVIIQLLEQGRECRDQTKAGRRDILAGDLPLPHVKGGDRKILIGLPTNQRRNLSWRLVWAVGFGLGTTSLVLTYVVLAKEPVTVVYIWLAFQTLWLALRSVFFHLAAEADSFRHAITPRVAATRRPVHLHYRLLILATALSKYQALNHPRGPHAYDEDLIEASAIKRTFERGVKLLASFDLPRSVCEGSKVEINVAGVVGDTTLSSISWILGLSWTGMDLYDSCILALRVGGAVVLIPSARVLSGRLTNCTRADLEGGEEEKFPPKGFANEGVDIAWIYWVPCGPKRWLTFATSRTLKAGQTMPVRGLRDAIVQNSEQVTDILATGQLLVALKHVDEVKEVVSKSTAVAELLCNLLQRSEKIELD